MTLRPSLTSLPIALLFLAGCSSDSTEPGNILPVARIVANPTIVPTGDANQTVVTLDGSTSSDADGDPLSFAWTAQSGTFVNNSTASSTVAQVTFPGTAPYAVTLTVSDGQGGSDMAQTTIALGPAVSNAPPIVVVSANPTSVAAGDNHTTVVTIDGSASSDPESDDLTFQWTVPSGIFRNNTSATDPTIQVTFPGLGSYTVTVTVSDGQGNEVQGSVTIPLS